MSANTLEETLNASARNALLREVIARIREHDVKHIYLQYVSIQGRVMGKVIPARHLERIAERGLAWTYLSAGGFAESRHGGPIGPSAEDVAEGVMIPDLSTFQILPWDTDMARVFCDHFHRLDDDERPGAVALSDSRQNLKRVLAEFEAALGYEVRTGCEPEMSWFPDGVVAAPAMNLPGNVGPSYHIGELERMRPVIKQVTRYGQAMGLDMIQADYEDPGQIEINFGFGPALATADRLVTYRQICMQVAHEFGMLATFMPKPVAGIMANGCHHHISLWRGEDPAFEGPDGKLNELGRHAIGGLLTHARGMSAIVAPTVNSYARFWEVGMFAPSTPTWGPENRQCLVRVLGDRMEYRAPDASCNPYLSHAVLVTAVRAGIEQRLSPGPVTEAGGGPVDGAFGEIPRTLGEALDAVQADPVVAASMSAELLQTFVELKTDEWHRACGAVTDWDREMYLRYLP
ncbi:MAG: glutamine synthetase [Conexibacter sp.]|nr:glutamine synthetase [Conexibacter sp.]